jgi:hypothetical protein
VTPTKGGSKYGNPKRHIEALKEKMRNIPYEKRSTFRSMSKMLVVPKSTLAYIFHSGGAMRLNSNAVLPLLTDDNKFQWLTYCFGRVEEHPVTGKLHYASCYDKIHDKIHLDEKWFYMMPKKQNIYLVEGEEVARHKTRHKGHIIKVMILAAVARPRFDDVTGESLFDGKIGIWPFFE